jgi:hypothetical protein
MSVERKTDLAGYEGGNRDKWKLELISAYDKLIIDSRSSC